MYILSHLNIIRKLLDPVVNRKKEIAILFILVFWSLVQWFYARPEVLISDWNSWRQADTHRLLPLTFLMNLAFYTQKSTGVERDPVM